MKIEDHVLPFHLRKDGVEYRIVHHSRGRIGGDTGRIALHTGDASLLSLDNGLRGDALVEVQRHQVVYIRLNGLQAGFVFQRTVDGGHWWYEIGLSKFQSCLFLFFLILTELNECIP